METLAKIFTEYEAATVIVLLILFCVAFKGVVEFILWIKNRMEEWRKGKNEPEDKEKSLFEKITEIDERMDELEKRGEQRSEEMNEIKQKLDDVLEHNKQQTIIMSRGYLLTLCREVKERGYIHPDEYETFSGLATAYVDAGGNSLFRNKIIPEIEGLEIK